MEQGVTPIFLTVIKVNTAGRLHQGSLLYSQAHTHSVTKTSQAALSTSLESATPALAPVSWKEFESAHINPLLTGFTENLHRINRRQG